MERPPIHIREGVVQAAHRVGYTDLQRERLANDSITDRDWAERRGGLDHGCGTLRVRCVVQVELVLQTNLKKGRRT